MLFYTSCSENNVENLSESRKEITKVHFLSKDGNLKSSEIGNEYSYFDYFYGGKTPSIFKEISITDLSKEEKKEYNVIYHKKKETYSESFEKIKLFKMNSGRKVIAIIYDYSSVKEVTETEEVSFMVIDKVPTFPGCEEGDKTCFSKMVQKHFSRNFDADMPKTLGLESGKKRVFIAFKIDKEGNVVDIKARAPHKDITEEVKRVMSSLPKMTPGEQDGKTVAVKYSIPFTLIIE